MKEAQLQSDIYDLLKYAELDLDYSSSKVFEAARIILDHQFGTHYSKNHPDSILKMVETLMANLRANKLEKIIENAAKHLANPDSVTFDVIIKK